MTRTISSNVDLFTGDITTAGLTPDAYAFTFGGGVIPGTVPFALSASYDGATTAGILGALNTLLGTSFSAPSGAGSLTIIGAIIDTSITMHINICRSRLAEALLRNRLGARGRQVSVSSAGIGALDDHPADETTQRVALRHGVDLSAHRARQLTPEITRQVDLILAMEKRHLECALRLDPTTRGKVFRIGLWDKAEVPDPCRLDEENHPLAYDLISHVVDQWLGKL